MISGNDLLESCPFFRNEVGGEGEREVGLTRCPQGNGIHRPSLSYGVSVLEPPPGETLWKHTCPLQKRPLPIESVDEGAHYYRRYFLGERTKTHRLAQTCCRVTQSAFAHYAKDARYTGFCEIEYCVRIARDALRIISVPAIKFETGRINRDIFIS